MNLDVVNAGEDAIDDVLEHHGEVEIAASEDGGVLRYVLANLPEDSLLVRLGGAGTEELNAAEPKPGDAVVLLAFAFGAKLEGDVGPWGGANGGFGGRRRGVWGGEGRAVDGVGEGVGEDAAVAGRGEEIGRQRTAELEVFLGFVTAERGGGETVREGGGGGGDCGGEEAEEEEEKEEAVHLDRVGVTERARVCQVVGVGLQNNAGKKKERIESGTVTTPSDFVEGFVKIDFVFCVLETNVSSPKG